MTDTPDITEALRKPLDASVIKQRTIKQNGRDIELDYISWDYAVAKANEIFGFFGWSHELRLLENTVHEVKAIRGRQMQLVGYRAIVRVTVEHDGKTVMHDGAGFGISYQQNIADAHEMAMKTAESDALKRALAKFGNQFGLSLYAGDDDRYHHVDDISASSAPAPANAQPRQQPAQAQQQAQQRPMLTEEQALAFVQDAERRLNALSSMPDIRAWWDANKVTLADMRRLFPPLYQRVFDAKEMAKERVEQAQQQFQRTQEVPF